MRKMFVLLLFLLAFNASLVMFAVYFTPTGTEGILEEKGETDANIATRFNASSGRSFYSISATEITLFGVAIAFSIVIGWAIKSTVFVAVALFVEVFAFIWLKTYDTLISISPSNVTIAAIFTLVSIIIGCLIAFTIIDMFSAQGAME